jgi:hypothetical protein
MDELEEDFDNRGTFYCATCWSTWLGEQEQGQDDGWMVEGMTVATLVDMFGNQSKVSFQSISRQGLGEEGEMDRYIVVGLACGCEMALRASVNVKVLLAVIMSMLTWHFAGEGGCGKV